MTIGALVGPNLATAQEDFVNGSGTAKARILRVGPVAANLSFAQTAGQVLADYVDAVARGEAQVFHYAALEDTVKKDVPETTEGNLDPASEFPPLRAETGEEGAAQGKRQEPKPGIVQQARADDQPSAHSSIALEGAQIPGVLEIRGAVARSTAGIFEGPDGLVREATGTVDIGELSLAGGAFVLRDLHWELTQRTNENEDEPVEVSSTFVVGSALMQGERQDGPITGSELQTIFGPINEVLDPVGLRLVAPEQTSDAGIGRLGPLGIRISDSAIGGAVLGPVLDQLQPVREPIAEAIIENCEDCANAFLVGDVTLAALAGGGTLLVELGGVTGTTEGEVFEDGFEFGGDFDLGGDTGGNEETAEVRGASTTREPSSSPGNSTRARGDTGGDTGARSPDTGTSGQPIERNVAAPQTESTGSGANSGAWAVGLAGALGTLAFAAADYRKLRARRREIPAGHA